MAESADARAGVLRQWLGYTGRQVRCQVVAVAIAVVGIAAFASISYFSPVGRKPWVLPIAGLGLLGCAWAAATLRVLGTLYRELTRVARATDERDLAGYLGHAARSVALARWETSLLAAGWLGASVAGVLLELRSDGVPSACLEALEELRGYPREHESAGATMDLRLFRRVHAVLLEAASSATTGEESYR